MIFWGTKNEILQVRNQDYIISQHQEAQMRPLLSPGARSQGEKSMKRRSKVKFTQIHVSVPVRLLEDFDETIGFNHSRSRKISQLMKYHLENDGMMIGDATSRQLMAALTARDDVDQTMKTLLLQILAK